MHSKYCWCSTDLWKFWSSLMKMKRYVALARVSSREQEREGFSLEVQEEALYRYAREQGGEIVRMFPIAETATKPQERQKFRELLAYAQEHASGLTGLLIFKVDRAARNLFDYVELERLEIEYGLDVICITQPTEATPAGRMMRRTLANMASFYTEQQSLDVREGLERRVREGLFAGKAPYGYRNVRINGRSLIEVHPEDGPKIRRIFELFAFNSLTLDSLAERLEHEGITYSKKRPQFPRSTLYKILRDRSYIGEVKYHGEWLPGVHKPIVDLATFRRVQVLLGEKVYHNHELTYGAKLISCGHCGKPITGELKTKRTKSGPKQYFYYRCARYNKPNHPRVRVTEADLDKQVLAMFRSIRIEAPRKREWVERFLQARAKKEQDTSRGRIGELNRQLAAVRQQQDELLNLRLLKEVDQDTYSRKTAELRDRVDDLELKLESAKRGHTEQADLAMKVFELSQSLTSKWDTADYTAKRRILEIVCLNFSLDGVTLVPTMRKPFQILSEGLLVQQSRGDRRLTFLNDSAGASLFGLAVSQTIDFTADTFFALGASDVDD